MDKHAPADAALLFQSPFQWAVYSACRESLYELDPDLTEAFSRTEVCFAARRRFFWLMPLSRQHCLLNFDSPTIIDDPLLRQQKTAHAGRYIHQLDVRAIETLTRAISRNYLKLALAAGRGEVHGKV